MVRATAFVLMALMAAAGAVASKGEDLGTAIDLTTFDELGYDANDATDDVRIDEVARKLGTAPRRFYLSGMIGPSFANLSSPSDPTVSSNGSLFAAGGALGIAFERANGRLRIETEGMGRSTYVAPCPDPLPCSTILTNNWSVMENVWRDLMFNDQVGVYGGGGIGAGGYVVGERFNGGTVYEPAGASFAWQFGGGLLWQANDRLTFDVGYRYFQIDSMSHAASAPTLFAASELMFTMRLFEPFRSWGQR